MRALWKDKILAESDDTIIVEGNHYFPPESVNSEFFRKSDTSTICPWKGAAGYYDIIVGHFTNKDAAWYYANPTSAAIQIKGYVAFWRGVKVVG
ncbi:MAG: DUF427 domain-containing protein [Anaerolineales bacterium]|nr:DUF427 domain-containing protein [Anaerolineales bacterium]